MDGIVNELSHPLRDYKAEKMGDCQQCINSTSAPVARRFRQESGPVARPSGHDAQMTYWFGSPMSAPDSSGVICFVDLAQDGLVIQFYGEKEQTSIHVPVEQLIDFVDWLNQRLGLPAYQVNPDFINTVRKIAYKIGGTYTYRIADKRKLKSGLKAIELAKKRSDDGG